MIGDIIGRRYARALFRLAQEDRSTDQVRENLDFLTRMMEENGQFRYFMLTPRIDKEQKNVLIKKMFGASMPEVMYSFLAIVIEKRRQQFLNKIKESYELLYNLSVGRLLVTVESARQLAAEEQQNLVEALKANTGKQIVLSNKVDPLLLGGILLRIGYNVIDTSIRTKLHKIHSMLLRTT